MSSHVLPRPAATIVGAMAKSILTLLSEIREEEIVLPDLQRDFVWKEEQIRQLLDSLMRGYPFGSLLLWNTQFLEVAYREFVRDFKPGLTHTTKVKPVGKKMRMVLDGQQRLQSFYLAVFGTHDHRRLYFNVTSGPDAVAPVNPNDDDGTGKNYSFQFWRDDALNRPKRFIPVGEVLGWNVNFVDDEIDKVVAAVPLGGDDAKIARRNIRRLRDVFHRNVPAETIDDDVIDAKQARTINEILDIFVRVNSGGTVLTRSDLMFSLIKTKWTRARESFDGLASEIQKKVGVLPIDKDFIIRGLLTVADAPPSFEVENIDRHWDAMQSKFDEFSTALKSAIDFCRSSDVRLLSASLIDPEATLFPVVYFLSKQKNGSVPDADRTGLRALVYFLLFNKFLGGRSPEARIRWLREVIQKKAAGALPLDDLLNVVKARQRHHFVTTTTDMLNDNPRLALNIAQPNAAKDTLSWQERAEVDHVFPQSEYRPLYGDMVDDIGNLAYLGKLRNIRKNASAPSDYFASISDQELLDDFLIEDRSLLAKDKFPEFIEKRRALVTKRVQGFLGR